MIGSDNNSLSLLPPQANVLGTFVSLISTSNLRYEGTVFHINLQDYTIGLQNVRCYGTEGRNKNRFQFHPSNQVFTFIIFDGIHIKDIVLLNPPVSFRRSGHRSLAIGDTKSKPYNAKKKPPLSRISASKNPQVNTHSDSALVKGLSVNDIASNPLAQSQFPGLCFYDPRFNHVQQSIPCGVLNQVPTLPPAINPPQSFYTTFPPAPISLGQSSGAFDFEAMHPNSKQYELWGAPKREEEKAEVNQNPYSIDGSFDMISRTPFEPIVRPYNPYGPIEKPLKHNKEIVSRSQRRHHVQPPPAYFRGEHYL